MLPITRLTFLEQVWWGETIGNFALRNDVRAMVGCWGDNYAILTYLSRIYTPLTPYPLAFQYRIGKKAKRQVFTNRLGWIFFGKGSVAYEPIPDICSLRRWEKVVETSPSHAVVSYRYNVSKNLLDSFMSRMELTPLCVRLPSNPHASAGVR